MKKSLFQKWNDGEISGFGSFQTTIFKAYQIADDTNMQILEKAFPYWFKRPALTAKEIGYLRTQVLAIQQATATGTKDFEVLANLHGSKIYTCRYNEVGNIWCDTMCVKDGKVIITEQNMQYYPAKVRFFYSQSSNNS